MTPLFNIRGPSLGELLGTGTKTLTLSKVCNAEGSWKVHLRQQVAGLEMSRA